MPERISIRIFLFESCEQCGHTVHYLGMGVHDPCTMNYMEVYGDSLAGLEYEGIVKWQQMS